MPSSKGKQNIIIVHGYSFSVQGGNPDRFYCSRKQKTGCKARVVMRQQAVVYYSPDHNHPPPIVYRNRFGLVIKILQR